MAGRYSMASGKVSTGAIAAAGVKSFILLNPVTNHGVLIEAWISFGAAAEQADIAFEVYRVVTLGSPAGTAGTVVKDNPNTGAASWTGLVNLTTEPTSVEVLRSGYFPLNKGLAPLWFPLGREIVGSAAGSRLGIRVVNDGAGAMTAVNGRMSLVWEE